MDNIDKLTLELLINKNQYRKFLAKTDPTKSKEYEDYLDQLNQYKDHILNITHDLLEKPTMQISTEINEVFETYVKTVIRYLQIKEMEDKNEYSYENDEHTLFGQRAFEKIGMNMATYTPSSKHSLDVLENVVLEKEDINDESDLQESRGITKSQSFWGKAIRKQNG
jgi:hypothetical protein